MYEIITLGKVPYPGMRGQEVLEKIEGGSSKKLKSFSFVICILCFGFVLLFGGYLVNDVIAK